MNTEFILGLLSFSSLSPLPYCLLYILIDFRDTGGFTEIHGADGKEEAAYEADEHHGVRIPSSPQPADQTADILSSTVIRNGTGRPSCQWPTACTMTISIQQQSNCLFHQFSILLDTLKWVVTVSHHRKELDAIINLIKRLSQTNLTIVVVTSDNSH